MKDEKKVTEKLNEVNGVRELSDEELAQVVGSVATFGGDWVEFNASLKETCPKCGFSLKGDKNFTKRIITEIHCPMCDYTEPERPMTANY